MPAAIDVDLRSLDRGIRRMVKAGGDLRPVWRNLRPAFRADQADHIADQESPTGGWPPLARSTKEKRLSRGGRKKKFTKRGTLRKSAQRRLGRILSRRLTSGAKLRVMPRQMSITSKVRWSGIHQEGGIAGRGSRIPKRTFMWVSDPFLHQFLVPQIRAYLASEFRA